MATGLSDWILTNGDDLQFALFFLGLAAFGTLERFFPRRAVPMNRRRRWTTNGLVTALNIAALGFVPISFIAAAVWASDQPFGLFNLAQLPLWLAVLGTLAVRAFISFGTHFLNHKLPWLWRIHRVHHLDTELDISTTVRFHPLELFVNPVIGLPVVLFFGLSPWVLALYELLDVVVTLFSHSNLRLPAAVDRVVRYFVVTPDLHRVHHSVLQPETDSNFGAVFPFWDLVFGTFRVDPRDGHERMLLGLEELRAPEADRVTTLLLSPLRKTLKAAVTDPEGKPFVTAQYPKPPMTLKRKAS